MDFKQLEAFTKTVELSSFSKAGEALYLSQPSISNYINTLEQELETKLIIRTTKDVKPTKDGRIFYEYAKNILSLRDKAVFSMKNKDTYQGEIEILASSVPAQYILPDVIVAFNKAYPHISFQIVMSDTFNAIASVQSQKCEIGVVGAKVENGKCDYRFIVSESIILIVPPDCKLTDENLTDAIYTEKFIAREEGSATRYHAEEYLKKLKIRPDKLNVVARLSNMQSIIHAVSKGLGISIVSEIAAREYIKNNQVRVIRPKDEVEQRDFYFVYRKDAILPPQLNLFIEFVCGYFSGDAEPNR
jgi:DNA-binding transcriptional LysR family regulator